MAPFPVTVLLMMHVFTVGCFTFFWITGLHGRLPKRHPNDYTAGRAIGMLFIPIVNFYTPFPVYGGLCDRVNELLSKYGLPGKMSNALAVIMCIFVVGPAVLAFAGITVLGLLYLKGGEDYAKAASATESWVMQLWLLAQFPENFQAVLLFFLIPSIFLVIDIVFVIPIFAATAQLRINQIWREQVRRLLAK